MGLTTDLYLRGMRAENLQTEGALCIQNVNLDWPANTFNALHVISQLFNEAKSTIVYQCAARFQCALICT